MTTITDIQIRDPFIVADPADKIYRLYGTSGFGGARDAPHGFVVRKSRDLKHWSEPQVVLSRIIGPQEADFYWAPEVHHYAGRWYLIATFGHGVSVLKPRARYCSIYVSDSPDGPFVSHSDGPITPLGWLAIDGTLHVDATGQPWLIFCREWVQTRNGEVHAIPLDPQLRRTAGETQLLFRASEAPWSRQQKSELGEGYRVTDGPWLHRNAKGKLFMLWSSFGTGGYLTGVARSASGDISGPWEQTDEPLFAQDGGHAMIFRTLENKLVMTLHAPNQPGGERARLRVVKETADGLALV
ncbi:MAG: glycoside hydrolase family 43 protein [Cephaloticoccus sp.]|nr:glycoside hydrolase family 43 protein [Cephaloticoccus sp.]MCF7761062.1 glycoside hydrolase family 43 protein [Cephaloticoccus sp.]